MLQKHIEAHSFDIYCFLETQVCQTTEKSYWVLSYLVSLKQPEQI